MKRRSRWAKPRSPGPVPVGETPNVLTFDGGRYPEALHDRLAVVPGTETGPNWSVFNRLLTSLEGGRPLPGG